MLHAQLVQSADHVARLRTEGILDADHRRQHAGNGEVEVGILLGQGRELLLVACGDGAVLILEDEVVTADDDLLSLDTAGDAVGDDILHAGVPLLVVQLAPRGLGYNGLGHGVRIVLLKARGQTQHVGLAVFAEGHDLRHLRFGAGERAGLVEDDGVGLGDGLEEAPALDRQVIAGGLLHR